MQNHKVDSSKSKNSPTGRITGKTRTGTIKKQKQKEMLR